MLCLSQIACATIIRGTNEDFKVRTKPTGAKVSTTLETALSKKARKKDLSRAAEYYNCPATPCEFKVPRRSKFVAIIEKEGFQPVPVIVNGKSSLSGQAASLTGPAVGISSSSAATITTSFTSVEALANVAALGGLSGAGSIFVGGVFAAPIIAVDAVSGSMLSLTPNPLDLQLTPLSDETNITPITYDLDTLSDGNDTYGGRKFKKPAREKSTLKNPVIETNDGAK